MDIGQPIRSAAAWARHAYSSRAAVADTMRVYAGLARALHEMTAGSADAGETPCAPPSPVGGVGEHHTGAPHGVKLGRMFWAISMSDPALARSEKPGRFYQQVDSTWSEATVSASVKAPVPACHNGGAYESLDVVIAYRVSATASGISWTVLVNGVESSAIAATAGTGTMSVTIPATPGEINSIEVQIKCDSNTSATSTYLSLLSLGLCAA